MKRKWIMGVLAVVSAVMVFLKEQFGLSIDVVGMIAAISGAIMYVGGEWLKDRKRLKEQADKWKDKKFWISFVVTFLTAIVANAGINIPEAAIVAIVGLVFGLFWKDRKNV